MTRPGAQPRPKEAVLKASAFVLNLSRRLRYGENYLLIDLSETRIGHRHLQKHSVCSCGTERIFRI